MNIDIRQTVADRAKKWHELSRLLDDKEIYLFLKNRFSGNGRRDSASKLDIQPEAEAKSSSDNSEPEADASANGTMLRMKKGDLMATVEAECKKFPIGQSFSAYQVFKVMNDSQFPFASKNPGVAVALVMRKLSDREQTVREVKKGAGKRPTIYTRI